MKIDTLMLQCLVTLAQTKSFTKTAEQLCRTQSAVSQQIAKLEEMLDRKLLIREKRGCELTEAGHQFYDYAKKILGLVYEATDVIKSPTLSGTVRFGLPEDFASCFLGAVLTEFTAVHPRVLLHIECDLTQNLYQRFKKREFDLVLVKMSKPREKVFAQDVWSEKLVWAGNKHCLQTEPLPLILSPEPCVYRQRAITALHKHKIPYRIVFTSPSYTGTTAAMQAEMGISVLPRNMVPPHCEIIRNKKLPKLDDTHISLLKKVDNNIAINSFEQFILQKLTIP